jgi:hypothetical protein
VGWKKKARRPMDGKHIPGRGCTCMAWNADECGCGVDWRSRREVELETLLAQSEARARELWEALDELLGGVAQGTLDFAAAVEMQDKHAGHFRKDDQ